MQFSARPSTTTHAQGWPRGWPGESKQQFTKVPSMLFDIEMEENSRVHQLDDAEVRSVVFRLQAMCRPSTLSAQVAADVECAARMCGMGQGDAASQLAQALVALGYPAGSISIRHSLGGGDGGQCLRNLRHTFLCLSLDADAMDGVVGGPDAAASGALPGAMGTSSGPSAEMHRTLSSASVASAASGSSDSLASTFTTTIIIDPFFREQFEVPVGSGRYGALVGALPAVFVGTQEQLIPIVELMCDEMNKAFVEAGSLLPPWRRTKSMMSKWLPRRSCDLSLLQLTAAAAAGGQQGPLAGTAGGQAQQLQGLVLPRPAAMAAAAEVASKLEGPKLQRGCGGLTRALSGVPAPTALPYGGGSSGASSTTACPAAAAAAAAAAVFAGQQPGLMPMPLMNGREKSPTRVLLEPMQRVVGGNFVTVPSGVPL